MNTSLPGLGGTGQRCKANKHSNTETTHVLLLSHSCFTENLSAFLRTLPMQKYRMQHLHSREAATGNRTYENFRLRRLVLNALSEHTVRPYRSHCLAHETVCVQGNVHSTKQRGCASRGCGFRCTQVRQVSKEDLMEDVANANLFQPMNHESAKCVHCASNCVGRLRR